MREKTEMSRINYLGFAIEGVGQMLYGIRYGGEYSKQAVMNAEFD